MTDKRYSELIGLIGYARLLQYPWLKDITDFDEKLTALENLYSEIRRGELNK